MTIQAIILAGGLGTRLRSVVQDVPKPLAPVNGHPFIHHLLQRLPMNRLERIVLSVGYQHQKIQAYLGSEFKGVELAYAIEEEPLGTGGGIKMAMGLCTSDMVLILNGDSFVELDLDAMLAQHREQGSELTIAVHRMKDPFRYGCVDFDANNRITAFLEKDPHRGEGYINAGVYLMNRSLLAQMPGDRFSFETDFLEKGLDRIRCHAFETQGTFIDIGIPEDYERAQHLF